MPGVDEALAITELGLDIFPLKPRGKTPLTTHGCLDATRNPDTIREWWTRWPDANIGVATGPKSRLYVIDIDGPAAETAWTQLAQPGDDDTCTVRTSRGRHLYYRCDQELPNTAGRLASGIDTRGTGGYVVAPPSIHPDGGVYEWVVIAPPRTLPDWIRERVTRHANTNGADPAAAINHPARDAYAKATLNNLYQAVSNAAEGTRNDTLNRSAFAAGRLIAGGILDQRTVEITLHGAASAAGIPTTEAGATITSGLTKGQDAPWTPDLRAGQRTTQPAPPPQEDDDSDQVDDQPSSSWTPVDILAAANEPIPEPDLYHGLFYPRARHIISGEPETMKSWLALTVAHHAANTGLRVLIINTDGAPNWDIAHRLQAIGLTNHQITQQIRLVSPTNPPTPTDLQALIDWNPDVTILDTFDPAAELIGADTNTTDGTQKALRTFVTPFRDGAVITIDHVTKNPEARGRYTIGSQRKVAEHEVHIGLKLISPPLTREGGEARIQVNVHKDRLGGITRHAHGSFGTITFTANPDTNTITCTVEPHDHDTEGQGRPTTLMQRVYDTLNLDGDLTTNQIINSVDGRKRYVRDAIRILTDDGYIQGKPGPNNSVRYHIVKPYDGT